MKYTNGSYLTAPYDCSILELNLPQINDKFLNSHYVEIASNNVLSVTINVDESNINKVNVGKEAKINITTLEKEYTGYVTNVASIASNGEFKVTIEFENDGNMTPPNFSRDKEDFDPNNIPEKPSEKPSEKTTE